MSGQIQCTAPLNIVQHLQTDNICKLKCDYRFNYAHSALKIMNFGSLLYFVSDPTSAPPVIYNDQTYNLTAAMLMLNSFHTYNGGHANAELLLYHTNTSTQNKFLYVCIPIIASDGKINDSATFLNTLLASTAQTASSNGGVTVFSDSTFTFNSFIPMKPFFSYTGSSLSFDQQCYNNQPEMDYVVFNIDNAISMSTKAYYTLRQLLPYAPPPKAAIDKSLNPGGLFYNPDGPKSTKGGGDIYIDCRPTGEDGEILVPAAKDTSSLLDGLSVGKIMNFAFIKILIGILLMVILWKLMIKMVKAITASSTKSPGVGGAKLFGLI
jgi:hypothetical protein